MEELKTEYEQLLTRRNNGEKIKPNDLLLLIGNIIKTMEAGEKAKDGVGNIGKKKPIR